jgi:hypothetical protein
VTDPWGGVADVVVRVLAADGSELASTLTDATGYYLAESIPVGEQAVHIEVPDGYTADPASQPVIVEDQAVSSADFALTLACTPPEPPTGLKVALTRQYAFVRWSESQGAKEYVVYRRVDGQDPFQQIGTSTQTTFRDRDYGMDDDFNLLEYYLVATNGCGASEPSDVATVRPRGRQ